MENIMRQTTAQTIAQSPSRFGTPACGHLWTSVQGSLVIEAGAVIGAVRDRGTKAGVPAFAVSVPGDNAWRPPTC